MRTAPERPEAQGTDGGRWALARRVAANLGRHRASMSAGSLAYRWFLSLFPGVIAALGFLALVRLDAHGVASLTHAVETSLPKGVSGIFTDAVRAARRHESGSGAAVAAGLVVALWSASSSMAALQQALDVAYEVPAGRSYLARRARALPLMAATFVLGGAGAVLVVLGAPLGAGIEGHVGLHGEPFVVVWTVVRFAVSLLAVSTLFSIYYHFGPNVGRTTMRWFTAGGALAVAIFVVASVGFSYYVTAFSAYATTYGPFAGVAILIFWLYLTGLAVVVGGEVNAELERARAARPEDGGEGEGAAGGG